MWRLIGSRAIVHGCQRVPRLHLVLREAALLLIQLVNREVREVARLFLLGCRQTCLKLFDPCLQRGDPGGEFTIVVRDALARTVDTDPTALRLMGADPVRLKRIAFAISIALAGAAGALLLVLEPVEPSIGREFIGRVFAIAVLGGMGSLPGTWIAAVMLGVIENLTSIFAGASWAPAVAFGFLLLTLAVRPSGLFGR